MKSVRKPLLLFIFLSVVLFSLTACGGGTQQPAQQPTPPPAAKTEPPAAPPTPPPVAPEDAKIARAKEVAANMGCLGCHTVDGTASVGPTWQGVFGHEVTVVLPDGSETKVTADEAYLRESILNANVKIVKGYAPSMPSYEGQISEEEIEALIAYIKTLKGEHK